MWLRVEGGVEGEDGPRSFEAVSCEVQFFHCVDWSVTDTTNIVSVEVLIWRPGRGVGGLVAYGSAGAS